MKGDELNEKIRICSQPMQNDFNRAEVVGWKIILRHDFCEVPPRVEYTLTELGESFLSVLDCMKAWGDENLPK